jgi:hypothetical protein
MDESTLTSLSQRNEAFWIGVICLLGGGFIPQSIRVSGQELAGIVIALGILIITVRLLVAISRILRTSVGAGRIGYSDGKSDR